MAHYTSSLFGLLSSALLLSACSTPAPQYDLPAADDVLSTIIAVNTQWQESHALVCADSAVYTQDPDTEWTFRPYSNNSPFWDNAAYHTGNMEVCKLSDELREQFMPYSLTWAEAAQWMGATSNDTAAWRYDYGERPCNVLFGDWQICFQTYIDLFNLTADKHENWFARASEVMEYEMSTPNHDYWWWADGLYMVMPVMTKLYDLTGDKQYLDKLAEYWTYSKALMYDGDVTTDAAILAEVQEAIDKFPAKVDFDTLDIERDETPRHLFYRDGKYVYPKHVSANGHKDFWARGCGWVVAGLAKVLADTPQDWAARTDFLQTYLEMCQAVKDCQQPEGYWTRSLLDPEHAPGPETSGTAFFTYGLLWGINNGLLDKAEYMPVIEKSWKYLTTVALQEDNSVGYVQPIGERAIPGQTVDQKSTSNFGTGAFLLAACEMYRLVR